MGLPLAWTKNATPEQKEEIELLVRNSTRILTILEKILSDDERALQRAVPSFDEAAWAYHQAYNLGELARLRKVKELFSFMNKG